MQIQELQAELASLQDMEAQTKQYQQRSVESLQQELKMHQDEVANIYGKIQDAVRVELDWVTHLLSWILWAGPSLFDEFGCAFASVMTCVLYFPGLQHRSPRSAASFASKNDSTNFVLA